MLVGNGRTAGKGINIGSESIVIFSIFMYKFVNSNQPTELLSRSDNNEVLVALRLEVLFCSILFCSMKTSIFVSHSTSGNFYHSQIPPSETI